jgi:hypothetical protein
MAGKRRFKLFECFGRKKDKKKIGGRIATMESQYEFLSIASGLDSVFYSPRSSRDIYDDSLPIHHHTIMLNGLRYHPYSALFSYNCDAALTLIHTESVPYDFAVYDALEQELQSWVINRYKDPPPTIESSQLPKFSDIPQSVGLRIEAIYALTDEEEVLGPMKMLELLRQDLSTSEAKSPFATLSEDERYRCLDFLVVDETLHRLRWKYPRVKTVVGLIASIPCGVSKEATGWSYEDCHGIDVWTRAEVDGSFSVRCRAIQQQPLFNAISLINEVDLHPLYMPHLKKASRLHEIQGCGKRAQMLARYFYGLPFPLADRDTVLYAFGCNAIQVEGIEGIIISAQSVPDDANDFWGYSIPPQGKFVREKLRGLSFVLRPLDEKRTELTIVANLDKQIAFIPQSIMHYVIKDMIKGLYKNMIKLNLKFETTEFSKRIGSNPDFYHWVRNDLLRNARSSS